MITVAILAGGKSSRFKKDKLTQLVNKKTLVESIVNKIPESFEILVISKNTQKFQHIRNSKHIFESFNEYSPIFGIYTGLKYAKYNKVLFLPGDCPYIKKLFLIEFAKIPPPATIIQNGKLHPLHCILSKYHISTIENIISNGDFQLKSMHNKIKSKIYDFKLFKHFDFKENSLLNINYMEEYYEAIYRQLD